MNGRVGVGRGQGVRAWRSQLARLPRQRSRCSRSKLGQGEVSASSQLYFRLKWSALWKKHLIDLGT